MKKMKIREIKSKVKIIREIKNNAEPIEDIASSEMAISENGAGNAGVEEVISLGGGARVVNIPRETPGSVREETRREVETIGPLYELGKSLGGRASSGAERSYKTAEAFQEERFRGSGSQIGAAQGSSLPENSAREVENRIRDDDKKYDSGVKEGGQRAKKGHGYAWET